MRKAVEVGAIVVRVCANDTYAISPFVTERKSFFPPNRSLVGGIERKVVVVVVVDDASLQRKDDTLRSSYLFSFYHSSMFIYSSISDIV